MSTLINLQDVNKIFGKATHLVQAAQDICFDIKQGETFGLVGESGSGKSTIGNMLIGLEPPSSGVIRYLNSPLWTDNRYHRPRPGEIQVVFQDPQSSLDPRMKVRDIILEPLDALPASQRNKKASQEHLSDLIASVGIKREHLDRYPHEFSGGQRQRIAIARALITDPSFIVLDEPTSALDVSIQAQVLNLLKQLKKERNLTYLFISHNMSVIRYMCDRVAVMYKGKIVEIGSAHQVFDDPVHSYTRTLLSSLPKLHGQIRGD